MQAKAPETKPFGKEAFTSSDGTVIRWLGNAGALINSRATCGKLAGKTKEFHAPHYVAGLCLKNDFIFT